MADAAERVSRFEALRTGEGRELLDRLRHEDDPAGLRLGTELRAAYPVDLVVDALAQHELRLPGRAKFSRAMDMFFTRAGLEQATAEVIARHRNARYQGAARLADLCCGIGGGSGSRAATAAVRGPTPRPEAARRSRGRSTSRRRPARPGRRSSAAPPARWCAADRGPNRGRNGTPGRAAYRVVPAPEASGTNAWSKRSAARRPSASSAGRSAGRSAASAPIP
jgi:hypothetical protein